MLDQGTSQLVVADQIHLIDRQLTFISVFTLSKFLSEFNINKNGNIYMCLNLKNLIFLCFFLLYILYNYYIYLPSHVLSAVVFCKRSQYFVIMIIVSAVRAS